jgi:AbrB family transcriptional regulator (stage V sporulation protein T)
MKATGIVRKIDELGRIVIPREIRKSLKIREGNPLEIYVEKNGEIILKKYAPMGNILEIASQYAETLASTTGFAVCITDTEMIIAVSGISKKDYLDKEISEHVLNVMEDRAMWSTKGDSVMQVVKNDDTTKYSEQIMCPIISEADAIGTVILFTTDARKKLTDVEYKLVQSACTFLSKQMEV